MLADAAVLLADRAQIAIADLEAEILGLVTGVHSPGRTAAVAGDARAVCSRSGAAVLRIRAASRASQIDAGILRGRLRADRRRRETEDDEYRFAFFHDHAPVWYR